MSIRNKYPLAVLDFTHVEHNQAVRSQGRLVCVRTGQKGWFCPLLERYPSRQDLAKITEIGTISIPEK